MATGTAVPREILEDRWRGAIDGPDGDLFSKDGQKLIDVLGHLIKKVTRSENAFDEIDGLHPIDELIEAIHVRLIAMFNSESEAQAAERELLGGAR